MNWYNTSTAQWNSHWTQAQHSGTVTEHKHSTVEQSLNTNTAQWNGHWTQAQHSGTVTEHKHSTVERSLNTSTAQWNGHWTQAQHSGTVTEHKHSTVEQSLNTSTAQWCTNTIEQCHHHFYRGTFLLGRRDFQPVASSVKGDKTFQASLVGVAALELLVGQESAI